MTEGPGSIFRPSDLQVPPRPPATPPGFVAYLDGSSDPGLAGWGFAVVEGGDGIDDTDAICVTEVHGPVLTNPDHPAYIGAQAFTINTAELTINTASPTLVEEYLKTSRSKGECGKTNPPEPRNPHLLPYP